MGEQRAHPASTRCPTQVTTTFPRKKESVINANYSDGDEAARARAMQPRLVEPTTALRPSAPRPFTTDPARCTPSPSGLPPPTAGHQGEWPRGRNFRAALRSPACPTRRRAILEPILEHLGRLRPAWCACPDRVCTFGHPARGALVQDRVCARFVPPPARLSRPLPPSGLRVRVRAGVSAHV